MPLEIGLEVHGNIEMSLEGEQTLYLETAKGDTVKPGCDVYKYNLVTVPESILLGDADSC